MNLLTPLLVVPIGAALLCLLVRAQRVMELANIAAFGLTLVCGLRLLDEVLAHEVVTECGQFFRADALSAWMVSG